MGKNKLKKWYANAHDCMTLRVVKASTEEEARAKFDEIFGEGNYYFGEKLKHAYTIPWKEKKEYFKAGLGIASKGELSSGSADRLLDSLHFVGAI
jgi:hypothetical protein